MHVAILLTYNLECLQKSWHSSVYRFFKSNVEIGHENGRKFCLFRCTATRCKGSGIVRRFLDSKDHAGTSNLKAHAIKCFSTHVINAAANLTKSGTHDGSIFAAFTCQGQQPVTISHCPVTSEETQ